jgi:hypothetical protein
MFRKTHLEAYPIIIAIFQIINQNSPTYFIELPKKKYPCYLSTVRTYSTSSTKYPTTGFPSKMCTTPEHS